MTGETFTYRLCQGCGSLQITEVPDDLGRYYDASSYSSFNVKTSLVDRPIVQNPLSRAVLRTVGAVHRRTGRGLGLRFVRDAGISPRESVIDIGSGIGENLVHMRLLGHRELVGSDPFLPEDVDRNGVKVLRRHHTELTGSYDWVVMNHSFEHVPDPHAMLASATRILAPGGRVLVRMPIMGSVAWDRYGMDWVQVDAPRHLVLYTPRAMDAMAASAGLRVERLFHDSWSFQFWGSELVRRGLPHKGASLAQARAHFSKAQIAAWEKESRELNARGQGDAGGYVLTRA
jgi:2-polyprenyl-3-methyl-5-hydroxy-6-metoxy-1,4-benzoquinol methylase